jgi:hypothetical protein
MRKLLLSASLSPAGLMLAGRSARAQSIPTAPQSGQQSQATKSVAGTVVSIGDKGRSFALEVNEEGKKQTPQTEEAIDDEHVREIYLVAVSSNS